MSQLSVRAGNFERGSQEPSLCAYTYRQTKGAVIGGLPLGLKRRHTWEKAYVTGWK